ncbi:MAG: DUF2066 domain-containing protein [Robiginitomaculum sp.]|nr:DUF2066 domain-containing protein [Robiginitomaculum sp.]
MFIKLLGGFLLAISLCVNAFASDPYTVSGVHVDAHAKNALEAQTLAIAQGQLAAANLLIERLTLATDRRAKGFLGVAQEDGAKMIRALEISNEKRSANRYLGDITVAFNRAAVEQYLRAKGLRLIDTQSRKRLVIPMMQDTGLWEPNPWSHAWRETNINNVLTPMQTITPNTDVFRIVANPDASKLDMKTLQSIGRIYGVQQILIVNARLQNGGYSSSIVDVSLDAGSSRNLGRVRGFSAAETVAQVVRKVEDDWKANSVQAVDARTITLPVSILYRTHADWIELQDVINGSAQIRSAQLIALSKSGAMMYLSYGGDMERLRNELAFKGVSLRKDEALGMVLTRTGTF